MQANREIEVKIINLGDPKVFFAKVEKLGGKLVIPRRLLEDENYRLPEEEFSAGTLTVDINHFHDRQTIKEILKFAGLEIAGEDENQLVLNRPTEIPFRSMRIRQDSGEMIFNAKEKRQKGIAVDNRMEYEVKTSNPDEVRNFLSQLGYKLKRQKKKYRTTYELEDVLVEVDESMDYPEIPPWAEVEGPSQEKVMEIVKKLGYSESDTAAISDEDYAKRFRK